MRELLDWLPTPSQHFLFGALAVLVYVLTTYHRRERRAPGSAVAWVMGLALLPYAALPAYLVFGQRKLRPRHAKAEYLPVTAPIEHWAIQLIQSFDLPGSAFCSTRLHASGAEAAAALYDTIEHAQTRLDICTYIIGNDAFGLDLIQRLARRARQGVQVRVLFDGIGSLRMSRAHLRALHRAGGQSARFRPLLSWRRTGPRNLRNHRKMVIADGMWLWCGGRNLAAEYFAGKGAEAAWLDLSFDLYGHVATAAAHQFEQDWCEATHTAPQPIHAPDAIDLDLPAPYAPFALAQFLPSGPDQVEDTANQLLIDACFRAKERFLVITPYFIPDFPLEDAIRIAVRRGVQVTIVTPANSNHRIADLARARSMRELAFAGVGFCLLPMMCHAKAVVVDHELAMCGSINLDPRSLLINHEASVVFYGQREIKWLAQWIGDLQEQADIYQPQPASLWRDVAEGVILTLGFQL